MKKNWLHTCVTEAVGQGGFSHLALLLAAAVGAGDRGVPCKQTAGQGRDEGRTLQWGLCMAPRQCPEKWPACHSSQLGSERFLFNLDG